MRYTFFLFLLYLISIKFLQAQYFSVYDINTQNYPFVTAKYLATDSEGKQISNLYPEDFQISENGKPVELLNLSSISSSNIRPLSIILTIDVSATMYGHKLKMVKEATQSFIDMTSLDVSECCISSYDDLNYLNCDFTQNKERLLKAIESLLPMGATDYNYGFTEPPFGAIRVAKRGKNKRLVIFIADGESKCEQMEIIKQARDNEITIFPITLEIAAPPVLQEIARETGGKYFENVENGEDLKKVMLEILDLFQNTTPSELRWESTTPCNSFVDLELKIDSLSYKTNYMVSYEKTAHLEISPSIYSFGSVEPGTEKTMKLKIKAFNSDFYINNLNNSQNTIFKINTELPLPYLLKQDDSLMVDIAFSPKDSGMVYSKFEFETDLCQKYFAYANGGFIGHTGAYTNVKTLAFSFPNGGETLVAGSDTTITWTGVSVDEKVNVALSVDGGNTWKNAGYLKGGNVKIKVPEVETKQFMMKILQGSAINSFGDEALVTLSGHSGVVWNAVFHPDRSTIITAGSDSTARVWDAASGQQIHAILGHQFEVFYVDYSPDGKMFATCSRDREIKLWDASNYQLIRKLSGHKNSIWSVNFSPDGKQIVSSSKDNTIKMWDVASGECIQTFKGHGKNIWNASYSYAGDLIVTASADNTAKIWKPTQSEVIQTLAGHSDHVNWATFSPDGRKVVSASKDKTIKIWQTSSGKEIANLTGHKGPVYCVNFSPDGSKIVSASADSTAKVWDAATGLCLYTLRGHNDVVYFANFSFDGTHVVTTSKDGKAKIWEVPFNIILQEDETDNKLSIISNIPKLEDVVFIDQLNGTSFEKFIPKFIQNNSVHKLVVKKMLITEDALGEFELTKQKYPIRLEPGKFRDLEIKFSPKTDGVRKAKIMVITPLDTLYADVQGKAITRKLEFANENIDFGKIPLNMGKDSTLVFIRNTGSEVVEIDRIELTGPDNKSFSLGKMSSNMVLKKGEEKSISLYFRPTQIGMTSSSITLSLKNIQNAHKFNLLGEGIGSKTYMLLGNVLDETNQEPINAEVTCIDEESKREIKKVKCINGKFQLSMSKERKYIVKIFHEGYGISSNKFIYNQTILNDKLEKDFYLSGKSLGVKISEDVDVCYFNYNSSDLRPQVIQQLKKLAQEMQENPGITLKLEGHTCDKGTEDYNQQLSIKRSESVKEFLIQQGVDAKRIISNGYGESKPVNSNMNENERQKNRRTECKKIYKISEI